MADDNKGILSAGARLMWRRRSILWWVFVVNVLLGAMGAAPAARQLHRVLRHSLAGEQLYKGFDLGMFYELTRLPEVGLLRFTTASYLFAGLFALFMLFISGGVLETYRQGRRRISTADFCYASGAFLWRFVKLTLFSLVPFALLGNTYLAVEKASDYLGDKVAPDEVGFVIWLAGAIVLFLITLFVRVWFDIAKVRAVAQDERRMLRNTGIAFDLTRRQVGTLLWMYLRISLVAWVTALIAFLIWTKLPPTGIWVTLLLLELVIFVQLASRLWQLASVTIWYQLQAELAPPLAFGLTAPQPETEPEPQLSLYPETELPPADA